MSLVAGSYDKFIWGFTLRHQSLALLFSYPSHLSPIKTVALSGSVVASGGDDDIIQLYDLSASSSVGSLYHHSATVTALSFYTPPRLPFPRNLVSVDTAGSLSISFFDGDSFVHLKSFSVHRKAINDLAVHPSGEHALTVAADKCLNVVDLVRGRRSCRCPLGKEASLVKFNAAGDRFFVAAEEKVSVHEWNEDARLLLQLECPKRVLCAAPARNGLLYTGGEDRNITAWDINSGKVAYCLEEAHTTRVKGIAMLTDNDGATGDDDPYLVASASSDGIIRVWDVRMTAREKPLAEYNTHSRLTCLAGTCLKCKLRGTLSQEDQYVIFYKNGALSKDNDPRLERVNQSIVKVGRGQVRIVTRHTTTKLVSPSTHNELPKRGQAKALLNLCSLKW
ncbi:p21-activated protein kinase-interacting protein 1-like protein, partial [Mucuna pruriens]